MDGLIARAEAAAGPLDLLVNNAGLEISATYADTPLGFSTVRPGFTTGGGMYTRMQAAGHPLLAIAAFAPGLGERLVERTGGNAIFRRLAADRERG